ncbi:Alpha/Beta hydrolase protein [Lophiotrema nucula]|uniref:Alpha/Beta hydrolase protein n=1 Tax=Lophiotrema nucula TaxID=690887 RepID=A0A6A5YWT6_9PLEO|nr:Alpha/Beta hydrolase protein [Lophiotrema nucula]
MCYLVVFFNDLHENGGCCEALARMSRQKPCRLGAYAGIAPTFADDVLRKLKKNDVINATSYGPTCPQAISSTLYSQQDEDCLNLNVWAPASDKKLPVHISMIFSNRCSSQLTPCNMVTGSSSNPQYQGNKFARKGDVFVSFNTRESIWACPNSAELESKKKSQVFGILDVEVALDWIYDNMAVFGSDPNYIVFGGHSSGSISVNAESSPTVVLFTPTINKIMYFSDYASRFVVGKYALYIPLLTRNSDGEGAVFAIINIFDADVAYIPDAVLEVAYGLADYASVSAMSGAQYGDARFFCPVDYLLDIRSAEQDTWAYRFFGNYTNVVGSFVSAPTHGTGIPFFLGGNECFDSLEGIKDPSAGPGWRKVKPKAGALAKLGVPGDELSIDIASTGDYNAQCQWVYNPRLPEYPIIISVIIGDLMAGI